MMAIKNLQIPVEKQDAFKKLLSEYSQSQKQLKKNSNQTKPEIKNFLMQKQNK
jgi:hypothetical protein